ncbi:MAG: Asp-tRNA(Asn)/Glu-tRNA(Gln) amidotransferase subunit GatC [Desulfovibrionaceae bacterium]|nr:Asp-tRNA(Asn)/Glu-tRNA(Gln) amidotransferase subunit GatC [Desulfovibrionaceae bacterium]
MKIGPEEVARIAALARLEIDPAKVGQFAEQFNDILDYMDKLSEVDTEGVEPMYGPVEHATVLRCDRTARDCSRDEVLSNAPENDGRFFIVPRIV